MSFCSGLHNARKCPPCNLVMLNTLKVVCFPLILEDTIMSTSVQTAFTSWNVCFCWGAVCFPHEIEKPSCQDLSSHFLVSVDKVTSENSVLLQKHLHRKICCFTLNTVSCPISYRAEMRYSGGPYYFLSQIFHVWQTSQWVVSYI